jgi:pimeloyl-ACP methyl ester carboxylesterase
MPDQSGVLHVDLADGRVLEAFSAGPADGMPLVFQNGTPTAAVLLPPLVEVAAARGLRTVMYSRPGYAGSTPQPGRAVSDAAADVGELMNTIGADSFITIGWSGGGPHALACAALLGDRCAAAISLAGVAPYGSPGLDWLAGMGPENVEEFGLALQGGAALTPWLEEQARQLGAVEGSDVADALGGLISDVDRASLTGDFAEYMAACFRRAVSSGVAGWRDDDLGFAKPWGFDLATIAVPVGIWQGGEDRMVPMAHGEWLAAHIPGADSHLYPDEGHLSLGVGALDRIVDNLVTLAGDAAH